jgi:hypothetical protein
MVFDERGIAVTSESEIAVGHLDRAVAGLLAHRADTAEHLARARAADGDLVGAHCLAGFACLMLARAELQAPAERALGLARSALGRRGGTEREKALVRALAEWVAGDMARAADLLDGVLESDPLDAMTVKLVHQIRFMLGDAVGMRRSIEGVLPSWSDTVPGHGFLFGCHAFALVETDELEAAERAGRRAVEREPRDAWGCHAVTHVHATRGETASGLAWLECHEPSWRGVNNFLRHLYWHQALFHLARDETAAVLALYDDRIRDQPTDDYRDVANAASLLRRLQARGVSVGTRWSELAALAQARVADHSLAFAELHYLMCLVGAGRRVQARRRVRAMERWARNSAGTQAEILNRVGLDIARLIVSAADDTPPATIVRLRAAVARLGGSRVQREIFDAVLDDAAERAVGPPGTGAGFRAFAIAALPA